METQTGYILGVDGGGTHTRAALVDPAGKQRGEGHAEAANFLRVTLEAAVEHIVSAVNDACREAGVGQRQVVKSCIGLAGIQHPEHHRQMYEALRAALEVQELQLETDARIALAGATDLQPGVVVIAGTGSIACGMNARGEFKRSGGWGSTIGDEGSGYYVGRRALEAVVRASDFRAEPTTLTERVFRHFNISSAEDLPAIIYRPSTKVVSEIAQVSKVVAAAAREGDEAALQILEDAATELSLAINAVIVQLGMQEEEFRVAYVGGMFNSADLILPRLKKAVNAVARRAYLTPPLHPPVIGAVRMATDGRR